MFNDLLMTQLKRLAMQLPLLPALAWGLVWGLSEWRLTPATQTHVFEFDATLNDAVLQRGEHLLRTRGCFGCHGQRLQGRDFSHVWDWVDVAVAPNLVQHARTQAPEAVARAIRAGISAQGRSLFSMPAYSFTLLSDSDISAMIQFMRHAPLHEVPLPSARLGWRARWSLITGEETAMPEWVARVPALAHAGEDSAAARGEYLAKTTCIECHGMDLLGDALNGVPPLTVLKGYDRAQFGRLLHEGLSAGGRPVTGLMQRVVGDRFSYLSEAELDDLWSFLRTL